MAERDRKERKRLERGKRSRGEVRAYVEAKFEMVVCGTGKLFSHGTYEGPSVTGRALIGPYNGNLVRISGTTCVLE